MHVKDRKVIWNSQHRFTKLHLSSVITYYDEMTGFVNQGTSENVISVFKDFHQSHLAAKLH